MHQRHGLFHVHALAAALHVALPGEDPQVAHQDVFCAIHRIRPAGGEFLRPSIFQLKPRPAVCGPLQHLIIVNLQSDLSSGVVAQLYHAPPAPKFHRR